MIKITGYSDTPMILTILATPKGVTQSGQACIPLDSRTHNYQESIDMICSSATALCRTNESRWSSGIWPALCGPLNPNGKSGKVKEMERKRDYCAIGGFHYMTLTGYFLTPSPSLSVKSILFVYKFGALFAPPLPLLCRRHIWKPSHS